MGAPQEFDRYARTYDQALRHAMPPGMGENEHFAEYKVALLAKRLAGRPPGRILDFGCGSGRSLAYLDQYFPEAEIWGYDVSPESLEVAATVSPRSTLSPDWAKIAGGPGFDAVLAANVFHHIEVPERLPALARCRDALAPDGQMFLFEHNPYNPLTRWVFERCPFDQDAEMLSLRSALQLARGAGFRDLQHAYTLFFPKPLMALRPLEPWLKRLPLGAQYYVQMAR